MAEGHPASDPLSPRRPSWISRVLRTIVRALVLAFVFGFTIGTLIRCAAERSAAPAIQYLG